MTIRMGGKDWKADAPKRMIAFRLSPRQGETRRCGTLLASEIISVANIQDAAVDIGVVVETNKPLSSRKFGTLPVGITMNSHLSVEYRDNSVSSWSQTTRDSITQNRRFWGGHQASKECAGGAYGKQEHDIRV